jgi:subtilisin family serine protease
MKIASTCEIKPEQNMSLNYRPGFLALSLLVIFLVLGFCTPVSFADNPDYAPGEILVGFKSSTAQRDIIAFEKFHSLVLLREFPPLHLRHYGLPENLSVIEARQLLANDPIVNYVEPNYISEPLALPTDPRFGEQWSLHNTGQIVNGASGTPDVDIDWPEAMNIYTGTTDVIVAVIDSGVGIDHPDFEETSIWFNNAESVNYPDFIDNDGNGKTDDLFGWDFFDNDPFPLDENGHGTLVASIIAGNGNNGLGGTGVSPHAQIMVLRVGNDFGQITDAAMMNASLYAASMGARVINYSAGGPAYSFAVQNLVNHLDQQGILFVAAAGNGGEDGFGDSNDSTPYYPSAYTNLNILSVAANDRTGGLSYFSNYGVTSVDLAASGTDIFGADITRSTTFFEGFETGGAGWTVGHIFDLSTLDWTIYQDAFGRTWVTDSVNSLGTPADYRPYTDSWLASPSINAGLVGTQLQYRIFYELEFLFDYLAVEVTSNGGLTWNLEDAVTGFENSNCPDCSINSGKVRTVDLSDYDNQSIQIRFRLISDGSGQYDGAYIDDVKLTKVNLLEYDDNYQFNDGTSFSAPLVSGVAALIMSQRPDLSHRKVRQIIIDSVDKVSTLSGKVASGGRLNAYKALQAAIDSNDTTGVSISGTIKTASGSDICAMILASGQYMFSCNPIGKYSLNNLPREQDGTVKRQIYADGFFPEIDILTGSGNDAVVMDRSGSCPIYTASYDPGYVSGSAGKRINIAGKVLQQNSQTPICAMVLANGQHMFSCDGTGSYALNIPLDNNGQFKLQVYADGFAPMTQIYDEYKTTNIVRVARATECQ